MEFYKYTKLTKEIEVSERLGQRQRSSTHSRSNDADNTTRKEALREGKSYVRDNDTKHAVRRVRCICTHKKSTIEISSGR